MFHIVQFLAKNEIAVVPFEWVTDKMCYWPSYVSRRRIEEAVSREELPGNWKLWNIKILESYGIESYESFDLAEDRLEKISDESEASATEDRELAPRPHKRPLRYRDTEIEFPKKQNYSKIEAASTPGFPTPPKLNYTIQNISTSKGETFKPETLQPPFVLQILDANGLAVGLENDTNDIGIQCSIIENTAEALEFQKLVLSTLSIMKNDLDNVTRLLSSMSLSQQNKKIEVKSASLTELGIAKPIDVKDSLDTFQMNLAKESHQNFLIQYLIAFGGSGKENALDRIIEKIMTLKLASQYSFLGRRGKNSFVALRNLWDCIKRALEDSFPMKEAEKDVFMMSWLVKQGDALNKQMKRDAEKFAKNLGRQALGDSYSISNHAVNGED